MSGSAPGNFVMRIDTSELEALASSLGRARVRIGTLAAAALRKAAYDVERSAKARAAVDTGAMRSSVSTSFVGDGRSAVMAAEVGPTVDYALFVELGTSRMGPQPFLQPAYEEHVPRLEAAIAAIGEAL